MRRIARALAVVLVSAIASLGTWRAMHPAAPIPPLLSITGRVLDPADHGVTGATVSVRPFQVGRQPPPSVRTDGNGAFRIDGLGLGLHAIHAEPAGTALVAGPGAEVLAGASDVVLRLHATVNAEIHVLDADGAPLAGASAGVYESGASFSPFARLGDGDGESNAEGVLALKGLDPESSYVLFVRPPAPLGRLLETSLDGWVPGDTSVRLDPAYSIRGVVRDLGGNPLAGATVYLGWGPDAPRHGFSEALSATADDGKFRIDSLRAGPYLVWAALEEGFEGPSTMSEGVVRLSTRSSPGVSVEAGATDVLLSIDTGLPVRVRVEGLAPGAPRLAVMLFPERAAGDIRSLHEFETRTRITPPPAPKGAGSPRDVTERPHVATVDESGLAIFASAPPDARYALFVASVGDGAVAVMHDARPGLGETVVHLAHGESIRGKATFAGAGAVEGLMVRAWLGAIVVPARIEPSGAFTLPPMPEGRWHLSAIAWLHKSAKPCGDDRAVLLQGDALAAPGSPAEINLKAERE